MPTDLQLQNAVQAELNWDPSVRATEIGVSVQDGAVTLRGEVASYAEKLAVEAAALRVKGCTALVVDLAIRLPQEHERDDLAIARAASQALEWNSQLPSGAVRPVVQNGWVTLTGEVGWDYQSRAAELTVARLFGVKGVANHIRLRPSVAVGDIRRGIHDALVRQADRNSGQLQIQVQGAAVTLSGTVRSWAEREAAALAAWGAPGVVAVVNDIAVKQ